MPESFVNAGRRVVGVSPGRALSARTRLFSALEMLFPVSFKPVEELARPDAIIETGDGTPALTRAGSADDIPTLVFRGAARGDGALDDVRLQAVSEVDRRLRGVTLWGQVPGLPLVGVGAGEQVMALDRSGVVRWTRSRAQPARHQVAGGLPELEPDEILRKALMSGYSLAIVATVQFLRELCGAADFTPPAVRATIIFDDPNVRWRSYGFIDYERLVKHADEHNYHAVMAMIPLDGARAHGATAALFRSRHDRVSLTFHGNSHVKDELLAVADHRAAISLCAQAYRRVGRFEARAGLKVDRVMTPPHGMCSASVATALAAVGFDALCAIHPQPWSTEVPADRLLAGWGPATFAGPSAVIPRFELQATLTDIALRAFMDNPIVLYGHHQDVASGLDLLAQAAALVNSVGDVQWSSLGVIANSNVSVRDQHGAAVLRPFAARVRLRLPEPTTVLVVEEPSESGATLSGWSLGREPVADFGVPIAVPGGQDIEVRLRTRSEVDPSAVPPPPPRPWAVVRRTATEARDRTLPLRAHSRRR